MLPHPELDGLLQRLRHSAAEHMNPAPLFNTQVLRGPCSAINLAAGRAVVAVEIPRSVTTPHVHKDGRIYRRVARRIRAGTRDGIDSC